MQSLTDPCSLFLVFSVSFHKRNCLSEFSSDELSLLHNAGLFLEIATLKPILISCAVWRKHFPGPSCSLFLWPLVSISWLKLFSRSLSWAQGNVFGSEDLGLEGFVDPRFYFQVALFFSGWPSAASFVCGSIIVCSVCPLLS